MLTEKEILELLKACRESRSSYLFCVVLIALTTGARQGASNPQLATSMGHRTLSMPQRYTHLDVEVTKKFINRISEELMKGENL